MQKMPRTSTCEKIANDKATPSSRTEASSTPELSIKAGMYEDFFNIWHAIGWDNFIPVEEYGSRLLTIQFLCTLQEVENGVYFRIFGKEYLLSWKNFASHLDFNKHWPISLDQACRGFNHHEFWGKISGQVVHGGAAIFIIQLFS